MRDQAPRLFADDDAPGPRRTLEPLGKTNARPRDEALARRGGARHDLAGLQSETHGEGNALIARELARITREHRPDLGSTTRGSERVVLMGNRRPECRHHRVADELLDRPAMSQHGRRNQLEVAAQDRARGLLIERAHQSG